MLTREGLTRSLVETRERTLLLLDDLDAERMMGRPLAIVNPLRWEIGHVAWFHARWSLRHALGEPPIRADEDRLFDSAAIPHDTRWDLPLPNDPETFAFAADVQSRVLEALAAGRLDGDALYFVRLGLFHEMMHAEAFTYTRQTLEYPPPAGFARFFERRLDAATSAEPHADDVEVPAGVYRVGAEPGESLFVFDNEKWAHDVRLESFRIARAPVTNGEFAQFVEDQGYTRDEFWDDEGRAWRDGAAREGASVAHPVYWRRVAGTGQRWEWQRREFDRWLPLGAHLPVIHVNVHEAEAYCRWAKRRLPSEAEWEVASTGAREPANLDSAAGGVVGVSLFGEGDSAVGCRQMLGNVWEWTSTPFAPYPGFVIDPYREYSEPWFDGRHRVLRGGCWATRGDLLRRGDRLSWRNFYPVHRRDVFAGFRTCAL